MAKSGKKSIPAKRGTKRGRSPKESVKRKAPESPPTAGVAQSQSEPRLARLASITPQDRAQEGYRELDVKAIQDGNYQGRDYKAGDVFRIALIGEGEPPTWVRAVGAQ